MLAAPGIAAGRMTPPIEVFCLLAVPGIAAARPGGATAVVAVAAFFSIVGKLLVASAFFSIVGKLLVSSAFFSIVGKLFGVISLCLPLDSMIDAVFI